MTSNSGGRAAVLVPGQWYSTDGPLLMFAGLAVERRGGLVHRIDWTVPDLPDDEAERAWVAAQAGEAVDAVAATGQAVPVLIGKSLGSLAAPVAAARNLPAVWLTPLLTDRPTVTALRQATAPFLLVGGTADPVWDGLVARAITPHVLEIDGADHGMFVPGPLSASAAVLGQVTTAIEDFLDRQVWPERAPA
ncbi:MAG: alpha/beta fold hydrolase [Streptosporangiaceae bacterium]